MLTADNYYKKLEVPLTASKDAIQQSYDKLVQQFYPNKDDNSAEFTALKIAYETLTDDIKRSVYNKSLINKKTDLSSSELLELAKHLSEECACAIIDQCFEKMDTKDLISLISTYRNVALHLINNQQHPFHSTHYIEKKLIVEALVDISETTGLTLLQTKLVEYLDLEKLTELMNKPLVKRAILLENLVAKVVTVDKFLYALNNKQITYVDLYILWNKINLENIPVYKILEISQGRHSREFKKLVLNNELLWKKLGTKWGVDNIVLPVLNLEYEDWAMTYLDKSYIYKDLENEPALLEKLALKNSQSCLRILKEPKFSRKLSNALLSKLESNLHYYDGGTLTKQNNCRQEVKAIFESSIFSSNEIHDRWKSYNEAHEFLKLQTTQDEIDFSFENLNRLKNALLTIGFDAVYKGPESIDNYFLVLIKNKFFRTLAIKELWWKLNEDQRFSLANKDEDAALLIKKSLLSMENETKYRLAEKYVMAYLEISNNPEWFAALTEQQIIKLILIHKSTQIPSSVKHDARWCSKIMIAVELAQTKLLKEAQTILAKISDIDDDEKMASSFLEKKKDLTKIVIQINQTLSEEIHQKENQIKRKCINSYLEDTRYFYKKYHKAIEWFEKLVPLDADINILLKEKDLLGNIFDHYVGYDKNGHRKHWLPISMLDSNILAQYFKKMFENDEFILLNECYYDREDYYVAEILLCEQPFNIDLFENWKNKKTASIEEKNQFFLLLFEKWLKSKKNNNIIISVETKKCSDVDFVKPQITEWLLLLADNFIRNSALIIFWLSKISELNSKDPTYYLREIILHRLNNINSKLFGAEFLKWLCANEEYEAFFLEMIKLKSIELAVVELFQNNLIEERYVYDLLLSMDQKNKRDKQYYYLSGEMGKKIGRIFFKNKNFALAFKVLKIKDYAEVSSELKDDDSATLLWQELKNPNSLQNKEYFQWLVDEVNNKNLEALDLLKKYLSDGNNIKNKENITYLINKADDEHSEIHNLLLQCLQKERNLKKYIETIGFTELGQVISIIEKAKAKHNIDAKRLFATIYIFGWNLYSKNTEQAVNLCMESIRSTDKELIEYKDFLKKVCVAYLDEFTAIESSSYNFFSSSPVEMPKKSVLLYFIYCFITLLEKERLNNSILINSALKFIVKFEKMEPSLAVYGVYFVLLFEPNNMVAIERLNHYRQTCAVPDDLVLAEIFLEKLQKYNRSSEFDELFKQIILQTIKGYERQGNFRAAMKICIEHQRLLGVNTLMMIVDLIKMTGKIDDKLKDGLVSILRQGLASPVDRDAVLLLSEIIDFTTIESYKFSEQEFKILQFYKDPACNKEEWTTILKTVFLSSKMKDQFDFQCGGMQWQNKLVSKKFIIEKDTWSLLKNLKDIKNSWGIELKVIKSTKDDISLIVEGFPEEVLRENYYLFKTFTLTYGLGPKKKSDDSAVSFPDSEIESFFDKQL